MRRRAIDVIEPVEQGESQPATHPFGFSRVLAEEPEPDECWEGMGL